LIRQKINGSSPGNPGTSAGNPCDLPGLTFEKENSIYQKKIFVEF
jgi:hypothetical protein